jgi:predicted dehydrogenase
MQTRIGIIGCGAISRIYAENLPKFAGIEVAACADLDEERSSKLAVDFGIAQVLSVKDLLEDPAIEIVVNLTIPAAHCDIALAALRHGKSVYNEKPLAVRRREAREMMGLAREKGLRVGCAPDTFLGGGLQTCRKLIDEGLIGRPIGGAAFMMHPGVESWHPNPEFFYKKGGGPMFDMGPYYLTALTMLLGPVARVSGSAQKSFPTRRITSKPLNGTLIDVDVPTHLSAVLDFENAAVVSLTTSFDVQCHRMARMEIYGSEGTLSLPDPNTFGGPVQFCLKGEKEWREAPLEFGCATNSRGIGVADMAAAIRGGRDHRASDTLAYHVLDVMHSIHDASASGRYVELTSSMKRPDPLPPGLEMDAVET